MKVFNGYILNNKLRSPYYLIFRCGMTHLKYSLKKLGKSFKLQKEILETEMNHDETDSNNYKDKKDEWLDYVENDVLCTAFSYARLSNAMKDNSGFSMKDCLSSPGRGWKYFNSLRTEEDKPIYIYNDKYMRWFTRQPIKGGRVCAVNQYYKSKIYDDILRITSEELNVKGNFCDIIDAYLNYKNKNYKIFEKEYKNQFNGSRIEDVEEKGSFISEKLSKLSIHQPIKQIRLDEFLWDFDAVSLNPSAMWN